METEREKYLATAKKELENKKEKDFIKNLRRTSSSKETKWQLFQKARRLRQTFYVGDEVWYRGNTSLGYSLIGKVIEVVKAGQYPSINSGVRIRGFYKEWVTYVILLRGYDSNGNRAVRWCSEMRLIIKRKANTR